MTWIQGSVKMEREFFGLCNGSIHFVTSRKKFEFRNNVTDSNLVQLGPIGMNHPLTYKELVLSYICDVWVYIDTTKSLLSKRILIQVLLSAQSMMHTSFPWCVKKCNMLTILSYQKQVHGKRVIAFDNGLSKTPQVYITSFVLLTISY